MRTLLLAVTGCFLLHAADPALPKAETILDRYVEVTGGKAAYEKYHNAVQRGSISMAAQGIKGTVTIYEAAPAKDLAIIDIEGVGKIESGTDGEVAWENSILQGPRIKEGDERAEAIRDATFSGPSRWRDIYPKVETAGIAKIDGKDCYKVILTPAVGELMTQYYDKNTGLLVRGSSLRRTAMGDITVEVLLDDYRKDGDLIAPHKVINKVAGQEFRISIDSIEYNANLPKDQFKLPPDIAALAPKPTADSHAGGNSGKLMLYMSGELLASENYSLNRSADRISIDGSGTATIGPMKIDIEKFQVIMDGGYHPVSAEAKAKLGDIPMSVTTTFAAGKATNEMTGKAEPKLDAVHSDAVVVNSSLPLYPWSILALRASFDNGEPQAFPVYIIGQSEVPGQVVYRGREDVEFANGKSASLHHLTATVTPAKGSPITLDFWVDDSRKIIKASAPSQNVEAYQVGYEPKPQP